MSVNGHERPFDDIEGWREDELVRRQARAVVDGEEIAADLNEEHSPLSILLREIRRAAGIALQELIDADLFSTAGIEAARREQAQVLRFTDLITIIDPLIEAASNAEEADAEGIKRVVEQQLEQLNGRQTRHADA